MAATKTKQQPVEKRKTVVFTSIRDSDGETIKPRPKNLRLIRVPAFDQRDGMGGLTGASPELVYEFEAGLLVVNDALRERDRRFFEQRERDFGVPAEGEPDAADWLEGHGDFGVQFFRQPEKAPPVGPVLERIASAAIDHDLPALVEIHELEEATWAREEVLSPARAAMARLEGSDGDGGSVPSDGLSGAPAA